MKNEKKRLIVAASIDVEEEGLFCGKYACKNVSLKNIEYLKRLMPLMEMGLRPTLFCVRNVFLDSASRKMLDFLLAHSGLEIGCHLHFWNTPPFAQDENIPEFISSVNSAHLEKRELDAKLEELFRAATNFLGEKPKSFRMGRWDLHPWQFELLARHGVENDASIRPYHAPGKNEQGPDHFNFPDEPFWIFGKNEKIFEIPLTVTPILKGILPLCQKKGSRLRGSLKKWGALAILPVYHPLWLMKLASWLHIANGGKVLSLTWHSSEMMPGGAPHMPDESHVSALLNKLRNWLLWLKENYEVESLTMQEIHARLGKDAPFVETGIMAAGS